MLDMGVHFANLIRHQLGDIVEVYGDARLVEPARYKSESKGMSDKLYQQRFAAMDDHIEADAEDTSQAVLKMADGSTVNWLLAESGHGGVSGQLVLGDQGCINGFGTRGGQVSMTQNGKEMTQKQFIAATPDFVLDPLTGHMCPSGASRGAPGVVQRVAS